MNKIANDKWKEHILLFMNARAKFDLSGINFKIPITGLIEKEVVERRMSFYWVQMDILSKTAVPT